MLKKRIPKQDQGVLIAIEGTDGSGKATQCNLLKERLEAEGYAVAVFDFPRYDQPSSHFVKQYLNGEYGGVEEVGPYTSSLFFALDRYEAVQNIRRALAEGNIVLANRYTGSNMAHQGTKFIHSEERRGFFIWLDNLEFSLLGIPRPTANFVLRVPAEIAQKLVDKKDTRSYTDKTRDLHEADLNHLQKSVEVYDDMCRLFPRDFKQIDCVRSGKLMAVEDIQKLLLEKVRPLLPKPHSIKTVRSPEQVSAPYVEKNEQGEYKYVTPAGLDTKTTELYKEAMGSLFELYTEIVQRLVEHAKKHSIDLSRAYTAAELVLPIAASPSLDILLGEKSIDTPEAFEKISKEMLSENYAEPSKPAVVTDVWPRNELDIVADMLYESSSLPLDHIRVAVTGWKYNQKASVVRTYINTYPFGPALEKIQYGFELMDTYETFQSLQQYCPGSDLQRQTITPRYGYDTPELIESAGVSELFERCFDTSLELYSQLQAAGYESEAQYAALWGHKMRWKATYSAQELFRIYAHALKQDVGGLRQLAQRMHEAIANIHPLLAENIKHIASTK